jgi:hypothetical protein
MRPLTWTIGALRPSAQLFDLFSAWFYRHPGLSKFRQSMTKSLEEPSAWDSIAASTVEIHSCHVKLAGDVPAAPNVH